MSEGWFGGLSIRRRGFEKMLRGRRPKRIEGEKDVVALVGG